MEDQLIEDVSGSCSVMRSLQVDSRLRGRRLHRIGLIDNTVYLWCKSANSIEIWRVNTLFPSSWEIILELEATEIFYVVPTICYYTNYVYLLVVAMFKDETIPPISLFQIDRDTLEQKQFKLAEEANFENVPLETLVLGSSKDNLFMYDRCVVMGPIPYWKLFLRETDFILERKDIADDVENKCSRFPIAISPETGIFARFRDDNTLHVSSESGWNQYIPSTSCSVNLSQLTTRGLNETYGRAGHKMGAVESPLTFYSDGPTTIAKVTRDRRHFYYQLVFDHANKEFTCVNKASARYTGGIEKMFYATVSEEIIVLIGIRALGVANLEPPSLASCAIWSLQAHYTDKDGLGAHRGGLSMDEIRKTCGYTNNCRLE